MHFTAEQAVAKGAAWLDERYPGWWEHIQLATLEVSSCEACVLGQVWTGCIPEEEQPQILAQVVARAGDSAYNRARWESGGYNILSDLHFAASWKSLGQMAGLGFLEGTCDDVVCPHRHGECLPGYECLTDAWTKLIISRRLDTYRNLENSKELVVV